MKIDRSEPELIGYEYTPALLDEVLPESVKFYVLRKGNSYFTTNVKTEGVLKGTYQGWCIDTDYVILTDTANIYTARVIHTLKEGFDTLGLVKHPENVLMVNYLINQDYVGKTAADDSLFTYSDVQRAIWELIDDEQSDEGLGPWSQVRVNQILQDVQTHGTDFIPCCENQLAIVLKPLVPEVQVTIIQISLKDFPTVCVPVYEYQ